MTEAQKRARDADNKIGDLSKWDLPLLKQELEVLIQFDYDIESLSFDTAEIDLMFDGPEELKGATPMTYRKTTLHKRSSRSRVISGSSAIIVSSVAMPSC